MAYIGAQPRLGNFQACDAISTSATDTFNLLVGGTAIFPQSAQHCLVSLNGVLQAPISSYTISGSTIVFASALTSADSIDFITILGDTLDLGVPSDDTVGAAQIKADLISGTTALSSAPADTDEFLVSDAGVLKRIDYSLIKAVNTPIFEAAITSNQSVSDDTATKAQFASEVIDTDSAYDNSTNYRFTVPSGAGGKYFLFLKLQIDCEANSNLDTAKALIYKNGSAFSSPTNFGQSEISFLSNPIRESEIVVSIIADLSAGDYIEAYGAMEASDSSGGHFGSYSVFKGYKLIT
jgi:hypothetical protein